MVTNRDGGWGAVPSQGHLATPRHFWCHDGYVCGATTAIYQMEARDAAKPPTVHRPGSPQSIINPKYQCRLQ